MSARAGRQVLSSNVTPASGVMRGRLLLRGTERSCRSPRHLDPAAVII
ncbi:hypothetical protein SFR_1275 [Streptomyces sp. FR-008]|nr:hypothetical protein SFR_1275 [Streptomyces sp. FR-008]